MSEIPVVLNFITKRHSRRPYVRLQVKDADGNAYDLTSVFSVRFLMYDLDGVQKVDAAGSVESPATAGIIKYEWAAADVDTAGNYNAEFDLDWGSGVVMTLPSNGLIRVRIHEDLDNS